MQIISASCEEIQGEALLLLDLSQLSAFDPVRGLFLVSSCPNVLLSGVPLE